MSIKPKENYVNQNEFNTYKEETASNFSKIFTTLEANKDELSSINKEVADLKIETAVIKTRMDSALDGIQRVNDNMDNHFELIKESVNARKEVSLLRIEDKLVEIINKEFNKRKDETNKNRMNIRLRTIAGFFSIASTGLVALIQIIPALISSLK